MAVPNWVGFAGDDAHRINTSFDVSRPGSAQRKLRYWYYMLTGIATRILVSQITSHIGIHQRVHCSHLVRRVLYIHRLVLVLIILCNTKHNKVEEPDMEAKQLLKQCAGLAARNLV